MFFQKSRALIEQILNLSIALRSCQAAAAEPLLRAVCDWFNSPCSLLIRVVDLCWGHLPALCPPGQALTSQAHEHSSAAIAEGGHQCLPTNIT